MQVAGAEGDASISKKKTTTTAEPAEPTVNTSAMQVLPVDPKTRPNECYFLTLSRAEINKEIRLFTPERAFCTLRICTFHWQLSNW